MTRRSRRGEEAPADETIRPEVHRKVHARSTEHEQSRPSPDSLAGRTLGAVHRGFWAVMVILAVSAAAFYLNQWLQHG